MQKIEVVNKFQTITLPALDATLYMIQQIQTIFLVI